MEKRTFIPNWYIDKKNIVRDKKIKTCIMVVLIINILLIGLIVKVSNRIKLLDEEQLPNLNNRSVKTVEQDLVAIEQYKQLSDFFEKNNLNYKNININKSSLEIDIEVNSYERYMDVIKCIEKKYSIKKLTEAIKIGDMFSFKIIIGV